jgi:hypothetical protein
VEHVRLQTGDYPIAPNAVASRGDLESVEMDDDRR